MSLRTDGARFVSPWFVFDKAWQRCTGYRAEDFRFVAGKTTFSTFGAMTSATFLYLLVIFGGRELMRNRKPLHLGLLFKIHNLFLTIMSGLLLVLFAEQIIPTLWRDGFYENICGRDGWTAPLVVLYYVSFSDTFVSQLIRSQDPAQLCRQVH